MAARHYIGDIRIGISGWNYAGWRGVFYPAKLAHKRELAYAGRAYSEGIAGERKGTRARKKADRAERKSAGEVVAVADARTVENERVKRQFSRIGHAIHAQQSSA